MTAEPAPTAATARYAAKKEAILSAATTILNRQGVKGMTLAGVATEVGVITTSLTLFVVVYFVVFSVGIWYVYRMIVKGPQATLPGPETLPNRPLAGGQPDRKEAVPS